MVKRKAPITIDDILSVLEEAKLKHGGDLQVTLCLCLGNRPPTDACWFENGYLYFNGLWYDPEVQWVVHHIVKRDGLGSPALKEMEED